MNISFVLAIPIHLVAMRTHVQPVLCAKIVNLLHQVGAWLSPGNMVFSTDITYLHDISEILPQLQSEFYKFTNGWNQ
jgi:hypothetical protein